MQPSDYIDKQIAGYDHWRGKVMAQLRKLIHEADPEITEEWKWETAVYMKNGMVCAVSGFKDHVKINFFKGVHLTDPHKLINNGLESKAHRSIDFNEGDLINQSALKELVREAVALNGKNKK